jgi:phospholipid transport system transporter-binding protein
MTAALKLPAVASLEQAPALLHEVDAALAAAGTQALRIDASALAEFDTSAVALLLHAQREARTRGATLHVVGAPPKLRELARLYGVDELLPLDGPPAPT